MRRSRSGSMEAFAEIVQLYEREIWRTVSAALADRVTAENLVQQSFVIAYERLSQYELGRDLGSWLKAIARHLVIDELRRAARETRCLVGYRDYVEALLERDDQGAESTRRLEAAVAGCRKELGPAAAQALSLRYDRALSVDEVAAALGRTHAATRTLLFRAREAIRECVQRSLAVE